LLEADRTPALTTTQLSVVYTYILILYIMFHLLALLLLAASVEARGVDPMSVDEDEDFNFHKQSEMEVAVDQQGSPSRLVRRQAAHSLYESSGLEQAEDLHDVAIHKQADTETVEKVQQKSSTDSKVFVRFSSYKFTVTATRGGSEASSSVSYSKFVLQNVFGQEMNLSQTNSAEVFFQGDLGIADATDAVSDYQKGDANFKMGDSLIIHLKQKDAIGSYYWITSKGSPQNDPTAWSMSGSDDGKHWEDLSVKSNYPTPLERHVIVGAFITSNMMVTDVVQPSEVQPCEKNKETTLTTTPAPPPPNAQIVYEIIQPPPIQKTVYVVDYGNTPCLKNVSVQPCPKLNDAHQSTTTETTTTIRIDTPPIVAAKSDETSTAAKPSETSAAPKPKETIAHPVPILATAAKPSGDQPSGDQPSGDQPRGDQPRGDQPRGDQPRGDQPRGDHEAKHLEGVFSSAVVPDFPLTFARKAYLDKAHVEARGFAFKVALDVDRLLAFIQSSTGRDHRGLENELSLKTSTLEFSWPNPGCSDDLPGFTDFVSTDNYDGYFSNEKNVCGGIQASSFDETGMSHLSPGQYELFWLAGQFGSQSAYNSGGEVALVKIDELVIADKQAGVEYGLCGSKGHKNYLGCPKESLIELVFEDPSLFEVPMFCSSPRFGDLVEKYPSCI